MLQYGTDILTEVGQRKLIGIIDCSYWGWYDYRCQHCFLHYSRSYRGKLTVFPRNRVWSIMIIISHKCLHGQTLPQPIKLWTKHLKLLPKQQHFIEQKWTRPVKWWNKTPKLLPKQPNFMLWTKVNAANKMMKSKP